MGFFQCCPKTKYIHMYYLKLCLYNVQCDICESTKVSCFFFNILFCIWRLPLERCQSTAGSPSTISGSDVTYAGGGGGSGYYFGSPPPAQQKASGDGGAGGGGKGGADGAGGIGVGSDSNGVSGTTNLGGGGGGGGPSGGAGGSGVVIVKEPFVGSSVWDMRAVFRQVKAGTWTS